MSVHETVPALVIGAGPAGLMAAEALAAAGFPPVVCEARPTVARKFLLAGKTGLNLTNDQPADDFALQVSAAWLHPVVRAFGPDGVKNWAEGLGQRLFTGSSGRVFPERMKASPLLRAWLGRLAEGHVQLRTRWRWSGFRAGALCFDTPDGTRMIHARATVLALGGASWPRLGSDAAWVPWLAEQAVTIAPFRPSNMGLSVSWSAEMTRHFGAPVKRVALCAGGQRSRGEFVVSARGIEGGGVYAVSGLVRDGAELTLDLLPDINCVSIAEKLARQRAGDSIGNRLRKALGLTPVQLALLMEWGRPLPATTKDLCTVIKTLPVRHHGPRPIEEAISSAGGIVCADLTDNLELRKLPGIFAAGEMLDWEAPTGGYLLTTALATGRHAGQAAAVRLVTG